MKKNSPKFNKKFIRKYDKDSDKGYIFEVDVKYPKRLHNFNSDLPFLPERIKIDSLETFRVVNDPGAYFSCLRKIY